jgi:glycosyltransferase involved in cell wall biosynthesis
MKIIYLDIAGRMHSLYKQLINYPPKGYHFITQDRGWDKAISTASRVNVIYSFQERVLSKMIPVNLAKAYLERFKKAPEGTDLTYATGHLIFRKEPWVVDLEFVTQLAGYNIKHFKRYQRLIEKMLASEYCKRIICWTEAGEKTVLNNVNCKGFEHKIEVVHLAVPKKDFLKEYKRNDEKVKLLFVGSANIPGEFEYKGGKEALEAFVILRQRYPDLELVIRSDVPKEIRDKYKGLDGLRLIEEIIPREQLKQEFKSADIFLFPTHSTPGLAILDAMSYELPVITTDVWANPEMVEDGKTGFLIKKSRKVQYYTENFIPNWSYLPDSPFMKSLKFNEPEVVRELVEKTSILIENEELRRKMGRAGRQETETGKFSIEKRNEKLKRIFDEATDELVTSG